MAAFNPLGPLLAGVLAQFFGPAAAMVIFGGHLAVCAGIATASPTLHQPARSDIG